MYVICTDVDHQATFVGRHLIVGVLTTTVPAAHAYTYDTIEEADRVARTIGLPADQYMIGTLEDFR